MRTRDYLNSIEGKVERILYNIPETRNCDIKLALKIWQSYDGATDPISLSSILGLTNFNTISRARRKFQSKGEYLPTDRNVLIKRGLLQKEYRKHYGEQQNGI